MPLRAPLRRIFLPAAKTDGQRRTAPFVFAKGQEPARTFDRKSKLFAVPIQKLNLYFKIRNRIFRNAFSHFLSAWNNAPHFRQEYDSAGSALLPGSSCRKTAFSEERMNHSRKFRKLIAAVLSVLCIVLCCTACGGNSNKPHAASAEHRNRARHDGAEHNSRRNGCPHDRRHEHGRTRHRFTRRNRCTRQ